MSERQTATGEGLRLETELERRRSGQGRPASHPHRPGDLALCPCCGRDLVYPIEWAPATQRSWSVTLRCPDCEWRGGGVFGQDLLDRFDEALDEGTQRVLDDLELLTRANMEEQVERFVTALNRDLILPEDF
jgi:predicted RNA-binding Zn-ribbon protein involved in translation (DUF1610 family)